MWKSLCCYFYYPKRLFFISAWNLTLNLLKIIKYMLNLKKNKLISHYTCWQPCVRILVEGTSLASHQGPQLRGAGISPQQPSAAFSLYFSQSPALLGTAFLSFSASEDIQPGQGACWGSPRSLLVPLRVDESPWNLLGSSAGSHPRFWSPENQSVSPRSCTGTWLRHGSEAHPDPPVQSGEYLLPPV